MKLVDTLLSFLFPRLCYLCGEPGDSFGLCKSCREKWARETFVRCPICSRNAAKCRCGFDCAEITDMRIGSMPNISLTFYCPSEVKDGDRVTERMIFLLKENGEFAEFFAAELAREIARRFEAEGEDPKKWILTYCPRSIENFLKNGVDQGEEVAKRLAKLLGCRLEKVFYSHRGAKEQKKLDAAERAENVNESVGIRASRVEPGACYLLFDDIITSGATVSRAAQLLRAHGAREVFPVSIARTIPRVKQRPHHSDRSGE